MKKFLIGTSALIGAALVAVTAHAEDPKVLVGGVIDFQAGYVNEDYDANKRDYGFRNDTEVSVAVQGRSDYGLGYGAVIDLEADVSGDVKNEGVNAARTYVFLDGQFGRVEMGSNTGAAESLAVEADSIARGTGGIDGDWSYFASPNNNPGLLGTTVTGAGQGFITNAALPGEHGSVETFGDKSTYNANKINYYSPRFAGFQVGASFVPDYSRRGQDASRVDNTGTFGSVFEGGLNYEGQFDAFGLSAAVTGELGDGNGVNDNLRAYEAGGAVTFAGLSVAGSYGDWRSSLGGNYGQADYYTAGAAYDFGPFGASVTYLDSTLDRTAGGSNDFRNLVIGADYKVAPGMTPYAEVSLFNANPELGAANKGTIVILGTELAF